MKFLHDKGYAHLGLSAKRCYMKNKNHVRIGGLKRARKIIPNPNNDTFPYDLPSNLSELGIAPPEKKPKYIDPFK